MTGVKHDGDKVDMTILPPSFLVETARALTYGAVKYDRTNYLRVEGGGQRYAAALLRHFVAWMGGEDNDPESGLHHLGCVSANLAMMMSCDAHGIDIGSWREPLAEPVPTPKDPSIEAPWSGYGAVRDRGLGYPVS